MHYVGLDVGFDTTSIAVLAPAGELMLETALPSEARVIAKLLHDLDGGPSTRIVCEAGVGTSLVRDLRALGFNVIVLESRKAARFLNASGQKSDRNDARLLAELARSASGLVPEVHLKSLTFQNIRTQLAFRHKLVVQCQALEKMMKSLVRLHGGRLPLGRRKRAYAFAINREMARLARAGINTDEEVRPVLAIIGAMRTQLAALDARLERKAHQIEVCRIFMSIPGVGPLTALSFYSAVEDPARFRTIAAVGAYLGIVPRQKQSGTLLRRGRITRVGNALTRTHLVMAASALINRSSEPSALREWGRSLRERIGPGKALVAFDSKLTVLMLSMWRSGRSFEPSPEAGATGSPAGGTPPFVRTSQEIVGAPSPPKDMRPSARPEQLSARPRLKMQRSQASQSLGIEVGRHQPSAVDELLSWLEKQPRRSFPGWTRHDLYERGF